MEIRKEDVAKSGSRRLRNPIPIIVDTNTGNIYLILSFSLVKSGDPDSESNGMRDDESVRDHSMPGEEMQPDEPSVMDEAVLMGIPLTSG